MARGLMIKDDRKKRTVIKHVRLTPEENELFDRIKRDTGSETDAQGFRALLNIVTTILNSGK